MRKKKVDASFVDVIPLLFFLATVLADSVWSVKAASNSSSAPFKVFRIFPSDWNDVKSLEKLQKLAGESRESEIDFWLDSRHPGQFADVMVSPQALSHFQKFMISQNLNYTVTIHDVQRLVYLNEFEPETLSSSRRQKDQSPGTGSPKNLPSKGKIIEDLELQSFMRRLKNDGDSASGRQDSIGSEFEGLGRPFEEVGELRANYPFGAYTNYATMVRYMRTLDFYYPHIVQLVQIGKTHEGRSIEGIKVQIDELEFDRRNYNRGFCVNGNWVFGGMDSGGAVFMVPVVKRSRNYLLPIIIKDGSATIGYPASNSTSKKVFWIDGNIHAREWASSHTALFIINQLVSGYGKNSEITHYVNKLNFIIVPCANPDGFEYSRSSLNPQIRLWRKNRSPERCEETEWGGTRCCQGVDLNRNFDFHWAKTGSSLNPCSNLYAGQSAFSEPEAKAVANYLTSKEIADKVDAFITLHTYAQMWIHPYSHETQYYPNDVAKMRRVAEKATGRLRDIYGTKYRVGTGADLLAPASGGSDDWAKEKLGVKYVYLVELRPKQELSNGFILKQEELIPTAVETFEGIKVVIEAVLEENNLSKRPKNSGSANRYSSSPILAQSLPNLPSSSTLNSLVSEKGSSGRSFTEESARNILNVHPTVLNQFKKEDSLTTMNGDMGEVHDRLQANQLVSKIGLSVSKNIAFARDAINEVVPQEGSSAKPTDIKLWTIITSTVVTTPSSTSLTSQSPTTTKTTMQIVSQNSTSLQQMTIGISGDQLETSTTTTQVMVQSTLSSSTKGDTKSSPSPLMSTLARLSEIQATSILTQPSSTTTIKTSTAASFAERPRTNTTNPTSLAHKLLSNEQIQVIGKQILNPLKMTSTGSEKSSTVSLSVFTATVGDLSKELLLPTTRSPTRQYVLRFLTSSPLVNKPMDREGKKKEQEEIGLDSPLRMDIPPLLPAIFDEQASSRLANQQAISTEEAVKSRPTPAAVSRVARRCVDKKYSCIFWIKARQAVCKEQERFMRTNCAFSCGYSCDI